VPDYEPSTSPTLYPREVGYFINAPVKTVRWASYGIMGDWVAGSGQVRMVPPSGDDGVCLSYVLSHNGYIIYSDVHSGLYILKYEGPHNREVRRSAIA